MGNQIAADKPGFPVYVIAVIALTWRSCMKNKRIILFLSMLILVLSFYKGGAAVVKATQQNVGQDDGAADAIEADQGGASGQGAEPGDSCVADSVTVSCNDVTGAAEPEPDGESTDTPEGDMQPEQTTEPAAEMDAGQTMESSAGLDAGQTMESATLPDTEESVSTGSALIAWLESHKNTGGTVRLTDHVTLDGEYSYCPGGMNKPSVLVDTDQYTITVAGEIEFLSDNHLTFSGTPDGKGVFCVAPKGMLSMQGIVVESSQCALWQEEGAGLMVSSDCRISGSVHYADTPYVTDAAPVYVVVEKDQTLNDLLPAEIKCDVNRQGKVSKGEQLSVSWHLEGTEKQQEQRRRFRLQGSFLQAEWAKPIQCTVIYNDYPLTFREVNASVNGNGYIFRGRYIKSKGASVPTLISEYSFDGINWLVYDEFTVEGTYEGFIIIVDGGEPDRAAHPDIYIRLHYRNNGTRYFSNVLCYDSGNLENVEDIGGSRGGGTSIINPPDDPQENTGAGTSGENAPENDANTDVGNNSAETPAGTDQAEAKESNTGAASTSNAEAVLPQQAGGSAKQPALVLQPNIYMVPRVFAKSPEHREKQPISAEADSESGKNDKAGDPDAVAPAKEETAAALAAYEENIAVLPQTGETMRRPDSPPVSYMIIVAGFVLLAVFAGIAGFYVHSSQSGTKR